MDLYHPSSVHIDKIWWVQEAFISFGTVAHSNTNEKRIVSQCECQLRDFPRSAARIKSLLLCASDTGEGAIDEVGTIFVCCPDADSRSSALSRSVSETGSKGFPSRS